MILRVPLTGTVLVEGEVNKGGYLKGDNKDPIRPVSLDLGNVSWTMVDIDFVNEEMIIDVQPAEEVNEDTGQVDEENKPIFAPRKTTKQEKTDFLQYARQKVEGHTKEELFAMSGSPRLKRPFKK